MKRFLSLAAVLLASITTALAQPFLPTVSPSSQSADSGVVTFQVIVTVDMGFSASIFLSARIPTLPGARITVSPKYLNAPYTDTATVTIALSGPKHGGSHDVIIEARNGPSVAADTVTLTIPNRTGWSIYDKNNSPLQYDMMFSLDKPRGIGWLGNSDTLLSFDGLDWEGYDWPDSVATDYSELVGLTTDSSGSVWALFRGLTWTILHKVDSVWSVIDKADTATGLTDAMLASFTPGGLSYNVSRMVGDNFGNIWIATGNGLLQFDGSQWHEFTSANSDLPSGGWHTFIGTDASGNVWLVSPSDGLIKYDGQYWSVYGYHQLSGWNSFLALDPDGSVWVQGGDSHDRAKKVTLDGTVLTRLNYDSSEFWRPSFVSCVGVSSDSAVWVGVANQKVFDESGLLRFDSEGSYFYTIGNSGLPDAGIESVEQDDFGMIWIRSSTIGSNVVHYSLSLIDGNSPPTSLFTVTPSAVPMGYSSNDRTLALYPNPVSERLSIRLGSSRSAVARLSVVDAMGAEVAQVFDGRVESGERVLEFDASALPSGSYFLRLVEGGRTTVRPLVIAR